MRKHRLWMNDIVFDNNNILFSAGQFNGLFKADIHGGEAEFISSFPNEPKTQARLHSAAIKYKDEILFLPDLSDYITLYHLKHNDFECIKFPVEEENSTIPYCPKIIAAILVDTCVYAFGSRYPCIICYDFETRQLKVYDEWFENFKTYGYKEKTSFFRCDICRIGNSLLALTYQNDVIVEFDLETEKISFHRTGNQIEGVLSSEADKVCLFSEKGADINTWDKNDDSLKIIELGNSLKGIKKNFHCSVNFSNEIWLFPYLSDINLGVVMDKKNKKFKTKELFKIDVDKRYQNDLLGAVWFRKIYNGKLYFMSVLENKLYCFTDSENREFCTYIYADRSKVKLYQFYGQRLSEQETDYLWRVTYNLEDLLDMLILKETDETKQEKTETQCGSKIYNFSIETLNKG